MAISNNYPDLFPSLYLNFSESGKLDPRISLSRASTGTYVDSEGIVRTAGINEPRFDYENGKCKGLLVEESRTNIIAGSQSFNSGGWTQDGITLTPNATNAPDGTTTATSIVQGTGNNRTYHFDNSGVSGYKTFSIFAKSGSGNTFQISFTSTNIGTVTFNTSNGTMTSAGSGAYSIQLNNGWYRFVVPVYVYYPSGNSTYFSISGPTSSVYIWGMQVESGNSLTSYIPTSGTTVTRAPDLVTINDLSWFNDNEGTFIVNANPGITTVTTLFSGDDGSSSILNYSNQRIKVGTGKTLYNSLLESGEKTRILSYSSDKNIIITSSDKEPAFFSTVTGISSNISRINIGYNPLVTNSQINGTLKSFRYYPTQITDGQLKTIIRKDQDIESADIFHIGIATTGSVLNLDSGISTSYSPESNTWYDLSGNNNHAVLYNSPSYTSYQGGILDFDNFSQYGYVSPSSTTTFDASTSYTISLWFRVNDSSRSSLDTIFEGNGGARIWMYLTSSNSLVFNTYYGPYVEGVGYLNDYYQTVGTITDPNKWYNAVVIHDKTNLKQRTYLNGIMTSERTLLSGYSFITNSGGGFYINNGTFGPTGSKFGKIEVYNRVLSDTEITQQFNTFRSRFGL